MRRNGSRKINIHLVTIAALAVGLSAAPALASPPSIGATSDPTSAKAPCWDSIGAWDGEVVLSQTGMGTYDSAAADDFTLTKTCRVRGITIAGAHFGGVGPADSENVTIYRGSKRLPRKVVFQATIVGVDDAGTIRIPVEPALKLRKGHYWLSVQANEDFAGAGQFGWKVVADESAYGKRAVWQNPGDGFGTGCTSWQRLSACGMSPADRDLQFSVDRTFG